MSLTSAIGSALTGLSVSSRLADLVSTNIANAATPGYVRREAQVSSVVLGGQGAGVTIDSVSRDVSTYLLNERRGSEAALADQDTRAAFLSRIEQGFGLSSDSGSLSALIADFDTALIAAAARPESESQLGDVFTAASRLVEKINQLSDAVQDARTEADATIASEVDQLNSALQQVQDLNGKIRATQAAGRDTTSLEDLRQRQIDQIASIVPLRQIPRDDGVVALYAQNGAPLIDGRASVFGFTPTRAITPEMTLADGPLSGLTLNGRAISTGDGSLIAGGSLAANFALRDSLAPEVQAGLDGLARDLVERFQEGGLDPTLPMGAPGLFTDLGAAFTAADDVGLAARLQISATVDPAQGGACWRLRDGLGATLPGPSGETGFLTGLRDALTATRSASSGALAAGQRSFAGFATEVASDLSRQRVTTEEAVSFAQARASALQEQELARGVDSDQELQKLLLIEKAFAANARVIQVVDNMLNDLLEI